MSFGFGISDIIQLALFVKDATETCLNSSQHIKNTGDVLADSVAMLGKLDPLTTAYFSRHATENEFAHRIEASLARLEDDIQQIGGLVEKWDRGRLFDTVWLPLRYTNKIDEKRARIEAHNIRIGQFLHLLSAEQLLVKQPAADAQNAAGLNAKLENQEKLIKSMREEARERDQMLQAILQKHGKENVIEAACSDDPQQWKMIEADLAKAEPKISGSDAQKILEPYKEELKSRKMRMAGPVLCADLRQGAPSTMAQFHLEYLRLHAATGSQHFPIKRIEAAGYGLKSDLTKRAIDSKAVPFSLEMKQVGAQRALNCVETSYGEEAKAFELIRLAKRLRDDREAHGVKLRHFQDCDHILCFNEKDYAALVKLRQFARSLDPKLAEQPSKGRITLLPISYSTQRVPQTFADVKMALNSFVESELDWSPPARMGMPGARIWHNPYRARQFFVPSNKGEEKDGNKFAVWKVAPDIKRATGSVMVMAYWQGYYPGTLVTIVGPKEKLQAAEKMARDVCG